ncbi:MAG: M1 family aminopeptidase [Candidatus Eisenbacteria bacterium]
MNRHASLVVRVLLAVAIPAIPAILLPGMLLAADLLRSTAGEPPPIPSAETRQAFLDAHTAGLLAGEAEGLREVHDEYGVTHYDVDLRLDIPNRTIYGVVEMEALAQVANLSQIVLDLYSPMLVDGVTVNGAPAIFTDLGNTIRVNLGTILQPGQPFTVRSTYHGTPSYTGVPFRWMTHGASIPMVLSYSEPYGAPAWWICKDDPKDKASFSVHVRAPSDLFTVSNGTLESVVDNHDGTTTCNWTHDYPMSPYLFSIATTNFDSWTETYTALDGVTTMDVDYYAYPEDLADAQASWGRNIEMMEYYATLFGEYPFLTEKYAIAEFQHPGAMEHQTATSMGWVWITGDNSNDFVVAHELSHSWVGDMITMRTWSHAWTKEGFGTLCEALYFEDKYGESYYHDYMDQMHPLDYAGRRLYNIYPPLDAAIYYKGAWVLHMLRHVIGEDAFFSGITEYVSDPDLRYGVSTTEDLRAAFEATSGIDLAWFFDEWIYQPGCPEYELAWGSVPDGGGYKVTLQLEQVQTVGPIFRMPIDVAVTTQAGEERFVVWDSLETQSFELHVANLPTSVALDPDGWLIHIVQDVSGAPESGGGAAAALLLAPGRPNPFAGGTSLRFALPRAAVTILRIYDPAGRCVRTLADGLLEAGWHAVDWDGRDSGGRELPCGVYHARLEAGGERSAARMVLLRE